MTAKQKLKIAEVRMSPALHPNGIIPNEVIKDYIECLLKVTLVKAKKAAANAKWAAANPEKIKAMNAKYKNANPEKKKASILKWRAENPEKVKAYSAAQYLRLKLMILRPPTK